MSEVQQQVDQAETQEPQVHEQGAEQPSLADLTGGEFESVEDLYKSYNEYRETVASQPDPVEYDEYLKGVVDYYKNNGDLRPYLEAASNDYDKMSPEGVLRAEFKAQYPTLSEKALDYKFKREVLSKYNISEEEASEEEIEIAKELMTSDAERIRAKLKEEQQKFLSSSRTEKEQNEYNEHIAKFSEYVDSHDAIKALRESKQLTVRYGDKDVAFGVENPDELVEMTKDNQKFWQLFADEKGNPDIGKFMQVAAFAKDPANFVKTIATASKAQGTEEVLNEIKNPSQKEGATPTPQTADLHAALLQKFAEKQGITN